MKLTVDYQYGIEFADYDGEDKTSFMWWTVNHLASVRVHVAAQLHVYKALARHTDSIDYVTEFFGGCGFGTAMVQGIFHPEEHNVIDLDQACVDHIAAQGFGAGVSVGQGDAKQAMLRPVKSDLIVCDFFSFTAHQMKDWRPQLDNLFKSSPKAIQITDTSLARLHLQRERYATALGHEFGTAEEYLLAYSERFREDYGYSLLAAGHREFAAMMFVPSDEVASPNIKHLSVVEGNEAVQA